VSEYISQRLPQLGVGGSAFFSGRVTVRFLGQPLWPFRVTVSVSGQPLWLFRITVLVSVSLFGHFFVVAFLSIFGKCW
jgi:hypothetical protein